MNRLSSIAMTTLGLVALAATAFAQQDEPNTGARLLVAPSRVASRDDRIAGRVRELLQETNRSPDVNSLGESDWCMIGCTDGAGGPFSDSDLRVIIRSLRLRALVIIATDSGSQPRAEVRFLLAGDTGRARTLRTIQGPADSVLVGRVAQFIRDSVFRRVPRPTTAERATTRAGYALGAAERNGTEADWKHAIDVARSADSAMTSAADHQYAAIALGKSAQGLADLLSTIAKERQDCPRARDAWRAALLADTAYARADSPGPVPAVIPKTVATDALRAALENLCGRLPP